MYLLRLAAAAALLLLVLAAPVATAVAQAPERIARIGVLAPRTRADSGYSDAFRDGLRELGWVTGKNLVIEERWADGKPERLPDLAAELVRLKVEVIFAAAASTAVVVRRATPTIPIVMAIGGDPVGLGLAESLARPGGNVTGLSYSVGSQTSAKQLELLREAVPGVRRVAVLHNPTNPANVLSIKEVTARARALGLPLQILGARGSEDLDRAFAAMAKERAGALVVIADSFLGFHRAQLSDLAARNRIPAMYGLREHVEAGGLMSYAVDLRDSFRRAATYVDKILKGARPGDLPIEQPTRFELVINLKAAKALGLTLPPSLLLRADQVIE